VPAARELTGSRQSLLSQVKLIAGDHDVRAEPVPTFYNLIDAAVVVISIPIALLVLFAQRWIVSGLTAGSFR
jgi:ABC-type glycerol-3-phosphate transport system permease component